MPTRIQLNKLTSRGAMSLPPGQHGDGGNLHCLVAPSGARHWKFIYRLNHVRHELGLGPCHVVSLQAARAKAAEYRELLFRGIDPLSQKRGATAAARAIESRKTFRQCADLLIEAKRSEWRAGGKNEKQWLYTLGDPCRLIHDRFVDELTTNDVMAVLSPIWELTPETASRLRGRIEATIGFAIAHGFRADETNPAKWANHLSMLLARRPKAGRGNHAAGLSRATGIRPRVARVRSGAGAEILNPQRIAPWRGSRRDVVGN